MKADKEEKVVEMDKVKTYINNHEDHNYTNRVDEFKKYLKEDFAVEDVAFAMYWWYENDREEIIKALFDLAYADGDFCEEEEYTLRYIAYHMHLNESEYERTLRKFINEKGKILPRRTTGACAKHQRDITLAIKRARHIAVLPYAAKD